MTNIYEINNLSSQLIKTLVLIWEASVTDTHHFLTLDNIQAIKSYVPSALEAVSHLIVLENDNHDQLDLWALEIKN